MEAHSYWVYMMTNLGRTVLYIGVTNDLMRRVEQHRSGDNLVGFSSKYGVNRLVYFEGYMDVQCAIRREKLLKGWRRSKKNELVSGMNPTWSDLAVSSLGLESL